MAYVHFGIIPDIRTYTDPFEVWPRLTYQQIVQKFNSIGFDDDLVLPWFNDHFTDIPVCWVTPDRPSIGVNYCGDSLIPPDSARVMIERLTARAARVDADERGELERLIALLRQAVGENRWTICFGV